MWLTVDATEDFKTFTVSDTKYKDLAKDIETLHKANIHVVTEVDSGISMNDGNNAAYTSASGKSVFTQNSNKEAGVGRQHGNKVVFPDFTAKDTSDWWNTNLKSYQSSYKFDGFSLSNNELYSECDGYCYPDNMVGTQIPAKDISSELMYVPGNENLNTATLNLNAVHASGATEFDIHNKFAFMQSMETEKTMASQLKTRPFIMSKSSISGSGKYAHTYSGDNESTWLAMEQSVHQLYLASTYGMPFHGADVCGFKGDVSGDLCARWYLLAATYPFSRNSGAATVGGQAPTDFPKADTDVMQKAMFMKYNLLRYMVTKFHQINSMGGVYYAPMYYYYPSEIRAYDDVT